MRRGSSSGAPSHRTVSIPGLTESFPRWRISNHTTEASDHYAPELPTAPTDSTRRRTGPCGGTVQCSNGARRVRGLPVSLLWGGLPDREEGPEGTWNEAAVHFQKLPHYYLTPASGVGRGNGRGGGRPGEVLGDARFSLRESSRARRPWILHEIRGETQAGCEEARAGGRSAPPCGESPRGLHERRPKVRQRHADVLHWRRQIRWLSRICSLDRRARKGREGLTATAP